MQQLRSFCVSGLGTGLALCGPSKSNNKSALLLIYKSIYIVYSIVADKKVQKVFAHSLVSKLRAKHSNLYIRSKHKYNLSFKWNYFSYIISRNTENGIGYHGARIDRFFTKMKTKKIQYLQCWGSWHLLLVAI